MPFRSRFRAGIAAVLAPFLPVPPLRAAAETAPLAVMAKFAEAAAAMVERCRAASGHDLQLTTGSTGKACSRIGKGAPFDALLSAGAKTRARLIGKGKAVADSAIARAPVQDREFAIGADVFALVGSASLGRPALPRPAAAATG